MADGITNGQRAIAAFTAVHAYAQANDRSGTSAYRDDASRAQECAAWLLCDLRHYAGLNSGAQFGEALDASGEEHQRARSASPAQRPPSGVLYSQARKNPFIDQIGTTGHSAMVHAGPLLVHRVCGPN